MRVEVLLFAVARERAGTGRIVIDLPDDATVAALWKRLADDRPSMASVLASSRAAVNEEFASMSSPLRDGAVVAVLPPVSGG